MSQHSSQGLPRNLPRPGLLLGLYSAFGRVSMPLWRAVMNWRLKRGKEHPERLAEKFGHASMERPDGPLVWLHGVSVGESMALRPLILALSDARPELNFLLTSSTTASAQALEQNGLPPRTIHQFAPADSRPAVEAFLTHWQPDAIAFSERDFWPGLIRWSQEWGITRNVRPLLINSRMSADSFERRRKGGSMFRDLLTGFPQILLQDSDSKNRFEALGVPADALEVVGSIKAAAPPLPDDDATSTVFQNAAGDRTRWLAASTHAQEVQTIVYAHKAAATLVPDLLTIVAPRKPEMFEVQADAARQAGLKVAMRSAMPASLDGVDMLVVDAIGEMGVWFRATNLVFMGFSLPAEGPALTGKNPFEALALGAAVVHGPDTTNFSESYAALDEAGAAVQVSSVDELAALIADRRSVPDMQTAAAQYLADARAPLDRTTEIILKSLEAIDA